MMTTDKCMLALYYEFFIFDCERKLQTFSVFLQGDNGKIPFFYAQRFRLVPLKKDN